MKRIVSRGNILRAIERVEKNAGAPGIDGMNAKELRSYLNQNSMENWKRIRSDLLDGNYQPMPLRRKSIPKPGGGERVLGIPAVVDRMIQQAITQALTSIFDPGFSSSSFGFRPRRKAHQAVKKAQSFIEQGYRFVVDMDLEKFFDRVNHDILMGLIAKKVGDKSVLKAIRGFLEAGAMENGCCVRTDEGTPQGGPLSPLLANVMLDVLDKELEKRGHKFVRYADDCNVYVRSRRAGERVMNGVRAFLETRLKLKVNEPKSAVDRPWKRQFLGFSFTNRTEPRIRLAPKSQKRFKAKVKKLTRRSWGSIPMEARIEMLSRYIQGWIGYFHLADTLSVFKRLDEWIRRRLRVCYLKQWKRPKTRRSNLVALGIEEDRAINISGSRKGCWRLSKNRQMHEALSNDFFHAQGLKSLTGCYQKLRLAL